MLQLTSREGLPHTHGYIDLEWPNMMTIKRLPGNESAEGAGAAPEMLLRLWPTANPHGYPDLPRRLPEGKLRVGRMVEGPLALQCPDHYMSACHFEISNSEACVQVCDLKSSNGTWLNGGRVTSAELKAGDLLLAGRTIFALVAAAPNPAGDLLEHGIVTCCSRMREVLVDLKVAALRECPVLVLGETGAGKGLFARVLHDLSERSRGSFVPVNCATLPRELAESELFGTSRGAFTGAVARDGLVRKANGGTLFLDEIGELADSVQAKLLTLLDNGQYRRVGEAALLDSDVRIVAATSRVSPDGRLGGTLRPDLRARLSGETLLIPPLRTRREDLLPLAVAALPHGSDPALTMSTEFAWGLLQHDWPENVRELNNVLGWCMARSQPGQPLDAVLLRRALSRAGLQSITGTAVLSPPAEQQRIPGGGGGSVYICE